MSGNNILTQNEKAVGMRLHLAPLAQILLPFFGAIAVPIYLWTTIKRSAWIDKQCQEVINFQFHIVIYSIVLFLLIRSSITVFNIIGTVLFVVLSVFWLLIIIVAAMRVNNGENFQYPFCTGFFRADFYDIAFGENELGYIKKAKDFLYVNNFFQFLASGLLLMSSSFISINASQSILFYFFSATHFLFFIINLITYYFVKTDYEELIKCKK